MSLRCKACNKELYNSKYPDEDLCDECLDKSGIEEFMDIGEIEFLEDIFDDIT